MKKIITYWMIYSWAFVPMALAQSSQSMTASEPRTSLEIQLQDLKEKIKADERNIQRMEEIKKDDEAQVDVDKATLKKFKAQLQEDRKRADKINDELNLEEEE